MFFVFETVLLQTIDIYYKSMNKRTAYAQRPLLNDVTIIKRHNLRNLSGKYYADLEMLITCCYVRQSRSSQNLWLKADGGLCEND